MKDINSFLKYKNVLVVLTSVFFGATVPKYGDHFEPFITFFVVLLVYASIRGIDIKQTEIKSYGKIVLISLIISFLILPLIGVEIAKTLSSTNTVTGFAVALSAPTTAGSAIIWTRLSNADVELATIVSIISILISPVVTPTILSELVGSQVTVPTVSILSNLFIIIVGGVMLTVVIPSNYISPSQINIGSTIIIFLLIYTSISRINLQNLVISNLFPIFATSLLLTTFIGGIIILSKYKYPIQRYTIIPMYLTINMKNFGIGILISLSFSTSIVVLTVIIYHISQQLLGALISDIFTIDA
jgi:predicted Na+-dependent transporter